MPWEFARGVAAGEAVRHPEQRQVPAAGEPRVERGRFDQAALAGAGLARVAGGVEAVHEHGPGVRADEAERDAEGRGLARAVVPRESVPVPGTDVERHSVERDVPAVALGDRAEPEQGAPPVSGAHRDRRGEAGA
jgi:hypothetical protein